MQQNIKLIYALVIKTIQNLKAIDKMVQLMNDEDNGAEDRQSDSNLFLTQILIADLIYGKHLQDLRDVSSLQHLIQFEDKFKELINSNDVYNHNLFIYLIISGFQIYLKTRKTSN